jgi:hypothetical protein
MHVNNNDSKDTYLSPPEVFKMYPVMSYLNRKFQTLYLPEQNTAIHESLTLWKGRLSFKQYIPLKSLKFGSKPYELCESSSGYLWSRFQSALISEEKSKTAAVVFLVEPLLGKGHTFWIDNFYSARALAVKLNL